MSVILLGLLSVALSFRLDLRPIRGFVISLFAFSFGYFILHLLKASSPWIHFPASFPAYQWTMVNSLLQFIPTLFMLVTGFARGQTRKRLFLTKGDLSRWPLLIPIFSVLVMCMAGAFLLMRLDLNLSNAIWAKLLEALPVTILFPMLDCGEKHVRDSRSSCRLDYACRRGSGHHSGLQHPGYLIKILEDR